VDPVRVGERREHELELRPAARALDAQRLGVLPQPVRRAGPQAPHALADLVVEEASVGTGEQAPLLQRVFRPEERRAALVHRAGQLEAQVRAGDRRAGRIAHDPAQRSDRIEAQVAELEDAVGRGPRLHALRRAAARRARDEGEDVVEGLAGPGEARASRELELQLDLAVRAGAGRGAAGGLAVGGELGARERRAARVEQARVDAHARRGARAGAARARGAAGVDARGRRAGEHGLAGGRRRDERNAPRGLAPARARRCHALGRLPQEDEAEDGGRERREERGRGLHGGGTSEERRGGRERAAGSQARDEGQDPGATVVAVGAVEVAAQEREPARHALARVVDARALARGDLARREPVDVAQEHRRATGLLERHHRRDQALLELRALDHLAGRGRARLRPAVVRLAPRAPRLAAQMRAHQRARHAREPAPQAALRARARRTLARQQPGLLHDVLGQAGVAHEAPRQGAHPVELGQHALAVERQGGSRSHHGSAQRGPPRAPA
jgi:hypothetical protein